LANLFNNIYRSGNPFVDFKTKKKAKSLKIELKKYLRN